MRLDFDRMYFILSYLQRGGEVYYKGRTLVWLDNKVVRETEKEQWVIDGLAIKGKSYKSGEDCLDPDAGTDCYMGNDMPFSKFVEFVNNMSPIEFNRILNDLSKMIKKEEEKIK